MGKGKAMTKITVRRKHIRAGLVKSGTRCPIALACKEHSENVHVGVDCTLIDSYFNRLPRSAQRFIKAFDAGRPVKPFTFILQHQVWLAL
jgi:hypothetical protein